MFYFRYGIRINPIQWYIVLSGKNEGNGHPALLLSICELILLFVSSGTYEYHFLADALVPITICLMLEKGMSNELIPENIGMAFQVTNIIAIVSLPVAIIHVKSENFSLSELKSYLIGLLGCKNYSF